MGIINVGMEAGMLSEPFLPEQEIYEVEIAGKESPYFQKIKKRPLVLTLSLLRRNMERKFDSPSKAVAC